VTRSWSRPSTRIRASTYTSAADVDWTTTAMHCTSRMPICPTNWMTMEATRPLGSSAPVGATITEIAPDRRLRGIEMTCATNPNASEMMTITPNVDQKRPRVSTQDRASARRMPTPSRIMADGTRNSFVASHMYRGTSPSAKRTPRTIPSGRTANPTTTAIPTSTAITTVAASRVRSAYPRRGRKTGRTRRHASRSAGFSATTAEATSETTTACTSTLRVPARAPSTSATTPVRAIDPVSTASNSSLPSTSVSSREKLATATAASAALTTR
jgi:hypothetical protein